MQIMHESILALLLDFNLIDKILISCPFSSSSTFPSQSYHCQFSNIPTIFEMSALPSSGPIVSTEAQIHESEKFDYSDGAVAHAEDVEKIDNYNEPIDPVAEKKLMWKVDLHVVPPLMTLFLLAFLDRVNIGNAKIQGMTKELKMVGQDYSIALFIFFIP